MANVGDGICAGERPSRALIKWKNFTAPGDHPHLCAGGCGGQSIGPKRNGALLPYSINPFDMTRPPLTGAAFETWDMWGMPGDFVGSEGSAMHAAFLQTYTAPHPLDLGLPGQPTRLLQFTGPFWRSCAPSMLTAAERFVIGLVVAVGLAVVALTAGRASEQAVQAALVAFARPVACCRQ